MRVHVIEPQALFASALGNVFDDLGLEVVRVSRDADFRELLDEQPALVFVDADFTAQEPTRLIGLLRTLLPKAAIAVYTGQRACQFARACCHVGANAVFSKAAGREEIVDGLRQMLATGAYTDVRLRG
ncbi:MAG: response regulator [Vulcanimicrobiaceae bacterium]